MPVKEKIYHKANPTVAVEMDAIDANAAVKAHKGEWSRSPWPVVDAKAEAAAKAGTQTGAPVSQTKG